MYKAIFIDIDGTLRNSKRELTQPEIQAVKRATEAGFLVVLCSGRPKGYTAEISKSCFASKYIITSNGGNIFNYETGENLYSNPMSPESCLKLYDLAMKVNARFVIHVGDNKKIVNLNPDDNPKEELTEDIKEFVNHEKIVQCTISDENFEKIKSLENEINLIKDVDVKNKHKSLMYDDFPKTGDIYYDIVNTDTCKGNAIQNFCRILNIDLKNTIGIGDSTNDLSMFRVVGRSIAMGNSKQDIKEAADEVTLSNDEHGVAKVLNDLVDSK
jgi:hypothetical protein